MEEQSGVLHSWMDPTHPDASLQAFKVFNHSRYGDNDEQGFDVTSHKYSCGSSRCLGEATVQQPESFCSFTSC